MGNISYFFIYLKMEEDEVLISLGFVEELKTDEDWKYMTSSYFPSKIGGKPAWLDVKHIPNSEDLKCEECEQIMPLLLQLYAPLSEKEDCYHRTIYIFCCKDSNCHSKKKGWKVLRCNLRKQNDYYVAQSSEEEDEDDYDSEEEEEKEDECEKKKDRSIFNQSPTCEVCGCLGTKKCSQCKKVNYCSKQHQILHWREVMIRNVKMRMNRGSFE